MTISRWYKLALFNLVVLTFLGVMLRYKIAFSLPFIEQKKLLHAHSHFAFNGWIGFILQLIIIDVFRGMYKGNSVFWNRFLWLSTLVNFGMLFSFAWQGYGPVSITISTISILLSFVYVFLVYTSLTNVNDTVSIKFVKTSLVFLAISSLGPFALAGMMASHYSHIYWYHNALYWFLHFQYNGWFVFAILGIFFHKMGTPSAFKSSSWLTFYRLMLFTCIPAYFLVIMLHERPLWVTVTNVATVIAQAVALVIFVRILYSNSNKWAQSTNPVSKWLFLAAFMALGLKICLQFFSAHPVIGQLAYSFRPIIIGYLHLVFLVFASLFILAYLAEIKTIQLHHPLAVLGLLGFTFFVISNEALLAYQGVSSMAGSVNIITLNKLLFANTVLMFISSVFIFAGSRTTR